MERNERMADLVIQAMDGDSSAFEELYRSTYKSVFFHAQKVLNNEQDVEDAVSEAFVRAFENLSKLQESALFQPWIDRIATNISLNMVRDGRYREASSLDDENFCYEPIAADADTPSMVLDRKGTEEIVGRMIDALPEVQRTTVILYYYDEMSVAAIAKTMGCSEGTVKSRLNYARKNLEQAVLAEEKCSVKLYSVTPALVFAAIRRMIAVMPISRASIIHTARRIAEEVQPSGFSSVSPDAESKAAKSSSAPEEIIRSTLPSKRRAYKTTGKKAPAGKASGKAASGAATKATAAAAAAAKTGVTAKIVAAVLAGTLLFGGGVLTASAAARENLSQFLENVPVIGDLLSRNSEERPSEQTSEPAVSEAIKEQSPLSPISAAPEEISNPPEEKEPIIVNEGSLEGTPLDPTVTYLAAYEPVFDIYRSFFSGNYPTSGGLGSDDILFYSFFTSYGNMGVGTYPHEYNISVSEIGYMLRDVNGDGIPELITGYMGPKDPDRPLEDTVIYDMHTLENGQPKLILASSPRHRYRLCQDKLILNDGSAGATNLYRRLFRYSSTDKELIYSLTMNQPYYYEGTVENNTQLPAETDTILTEEEFKAKENAIYANVVHLELKPLPFTNDNSTISSSQLDGNILTPEYFPDDNFLVILQTCYPSGLTAEQAKEVTVLNIPHSNISDLTGVSYFSNLEVLDISGNHLTSLDTGMMPRLRELNAAGNPITSFDFSNNTALEKLGIAYTRAPVLDLSPCPTVECIDSVVEQMGLNYTGSISSTITYPAAAVKIANGRYMIDLSLVVGKENTDRVYRDQFIYVSYDYDKETGLLTFSVDENKIVDGKYTDYGFTIDYNYDNGNPDFTWRVSLVIPKFGS